MPLFYRIAVATPLRRSFIYLPPSDASIPVKPVGCRVVIPFGRQKLLGIIISVETELSDEVAINKLKAIEHCLDETPLIPANMLEFYIWAANYYQTGPGDALMQCLPALARQQKPVKRQMEKVWKLTELGKQTETATFGKRSPKQLALLEVFQQQHSLNSASILQQGFSTAHRSALEAKGIIESFDQFPEEISPTHTEKQNKQIELNPEQQHAISGISANLNNFNCNLIEGITGSGKTEVYLSIIEKVLSSGKQVLILVPEIGLTPQTYDRIQRHLNYKVGLLHSGLSDRDRTDVWLDMASGRLRIVLGTRSAIFVPMADPGLIILDEEHDASYKQQDSYRYHARDLAIKRASMANIPVVLGSATPSMESLHNALTGKYHLYELTKKAVALKSAPVELVDLTHCNHQDGVSQPVIDRMQQHLSKGEQVLLFLNRRGFAPSLLCNSCGWVASCNYCDARLTLHSQPPKLLCHHCNHKQYIPHQCPNCRSSELQAIGQGTARTEAYINRIFQNNKVIRIDRDSVKNSKEFTIQLEPVHAGEACILIGTQMLAKGHDFPEVTLVVVLDADAGLFSSDFRAAEKTSQLLTQVAGRSGRSHKVGHVMVQTWHPTHPVFEYLQFGGYGAFARDHLLPLRKIANLPPIQPMAMIRADSKREHLALAFLDKVSQLLPEQALQTGPFPAILSKRAGYFRFWLSIQCANRGQLQKILTNLSQQIESSSLTSQISWGIDVDPVDIG